MKRPPFDIDVRLRRIASAQLGVITVAQAERRGVDRHALQRRVEAGLLVQVFDGVVRVVDRGQSALQRILAAGLVVTGSTIIGASAAVVHDLPLPRRLRVVSADVMLATARGRAVRREGIRTFRTDAELSARSWMGARVATPELTLATLWRQHTASGIERCLDHCLATGTVTVESVWETTQAMPIRLVGARSPLHRLLMDRSDGRVGHRSGLEQRVRRWLDDAGLPRPRRNYLVDVPGGTVEVDFAWPHARVALEVSPFVTHGSRAKQERDAERRRLLTLAGWRVVEALDADLVDQRAFGRVARSLRLLLADAA